MQDPLVAILAARRTPIGAFQGVLAGRSAPQLAATAVRALLDETELDGLEVDALFLGCVLAAGLGQAPARQAAHDAGLPKSVASTTVNKVCGSGMEAVRLAHDGIRAGSFQIAVAGGMESMSNAPYLVSRHHRAALGHQRLTDHMLHDGLENPADGRVMGSFAEDCASEYGFSRERQDAYAARSLQRAQGAAAAGRFDREIVPLSVGDQRVSADEIPARHDLARITQLQPCFRERGGTVTAASASSLADGAAALLCVPRRWAESRGLSPLAVIRGHTVHAQEPERFTTAPIGAIEKLRAMVAWREQDVDLYEINEAFAVVPMAAMETLALDPGKVNIHGGACALGHPIGASGARILVTLIHALHTHGMRNGIATLCIGGGEATAVALEVPR